MPRIAASAPADKPLPSRQQRFVLEYLVDRKAAAARRAGYWKALSKSYGYGLLNMPAAKAAIAAGLARQAAPMTR
jgi:phage terminase small subunit